jgi:hypothetical protein
VDNRLQKINEIILTRAHKGFTKNRQIQECIINIVETIAYSEKNKIPGFVLALDMAKAFDTVRHDFMKKVYQFYGIGPYMINAMCTISTNRTAAIIQDDGTTAAPFKLGSGFPQGSPPSPNKFNICEQILILKFELDPAIQKIKPLLPQFTDFPLHAPGAAPGPVPVPVLVPVPDPRTIRLYGESENKGETGVVEAFADDTTPVAKLEERAILKIKDTLKTFADISGLKCNVEKSQIMLTGTQMVPEYIQESGFSLVNIVTILGFEITRDPGELDRNFDKAIEKIEKIARFWSRFKLSLAGRIMVAKSLMLSQITYYGSIISLSEDKENKLTDTFSKFIVQNLKVSKKDVFLPVANGGLGFFDLKIFIKSLQCNWAKKAVFSTIDCWRQDINALSGMNTVLADPENFCPEQNPILRGVVSSFYDFKRCYNLVNENFRSSLILGNPNLIKEKRYGIPVGSSFWTEKLQQPHGDISKITISDIITEQGRLKNLDNLNNVFQTTFNRESYVEIKKVVETSLYVINRDRTLLENVRFTSLIDFVRRFKQGSCNFRKIMEVASYGKMNNANNNKIKTYFRLIEHEKLPDQELKKFSGEWMKIHYPMKVRDFVFKFRNNLLGINTRVSHFAHNVNRGCTFCSISNGGVNTPDETFLHLFFVCPHVKKVLGDFMTNYMFDYGPLTDTQLKKFIFTGTNVITDKIDNAFISAISITICFYLWECKLQKKLPVLAGLTNELFYSLENMRKASSQIKRDMDLRLHICRSWEEQVSRRR